MEINMRKPIFFEPVFKHVIWGGSKLREDFGYNVEGDDTGECWGISALPEGDVTVKNGDYSGKKLSWLYGNVPELFFGHCSSEGQERGQAVNDNKVSVRKFPLLVKIIDAHADLSIQVHPDDAYATSHENGAQGKSECWYILDCDEGSSLIVGHNASTREELCSMINTGRWDELIREIPVRKGDFIFIPPGTVHAIKGGIVLLETQQSSNITYRIYDYGRTINGRPRELHIDQSKEIITVPAPSVKDSIIHENGTEGLRELISCEPFRVWRLKVCDSSRITAYVLEDSPVFRLISVTDGTGTIADEPVNKGDHLMLAADCGSVSVRGDLTAILSAPFKA